MNTFEKNTPLLLAAYEAWNSLSTFRTKRHRYKRFTYGDQWSDPVRHGSDIVSAAERAERDGRRPMTNNLLRRLVKSVIGRFRYRRDEGAPLPDSIREVYDANNLDELDCRTLEEFLISGCAIQRVATERTIRGRGRWVEPVSPDDFFAAPLRDPRGWDTEIVGMCHDWSIPEAVIRLAGGNIRLASNIREHYIKLGLDPEAWPPVAGAAGTSFFRPGSRGRCRVIEVWTLEASEVLQCHDPEKATWFTIPVAGMGRLEKINACRREAGKRVIIHKWMPRTTWRCHWLAPDGTVLLSHSAGSTDGSHPFHFRFYPLIDGEIHSLVEDVIDQQIYINELISLIDHVVSCSAKGVLLFPAELKISGMTWEEVCKAWSSPAGVIPINGTGGEGLPQQIHTAGTNVGAGELLATQMRMFEDVSGVSNALMGRSSSGNIGAEHYESQVRNAIIAIADILETYNNFVSTRNAHLAC